jgi:NADPH2:quinone reductase
MKAITFEKFGSSQTLQITTVPDLKPAPNEVLIRNEFTSVNPVDWKIRQGYLQELMPHQLPIIPGWDAAGVVIGVGNAATKFKVGDRVYAYARLPIVQRGTYAEQVSLPEDYWAKIPDAVTTAEAASVPLVALTAYQALHELAKIRVGDHVLVTAGAGGVGSFAIQFAKLAGAKVTATGSRSNHGYMQELGADFVIDYTGGKTVADGRSIAPQGFDVVLDGAGAQALNDAWQLIKRGGRLVSIVETPNEELAKEKQVQAAFHFVYPNGEQLGQIAGLIAAKKVRVPSYQIRSIREAAAAQDENQARHVRGKVVLAVDFA